MTFANTVRFLLTGLSSFLAGFTIYVAWQYMRVYAAAPRDWRRLLPFHVWTIASSYCLLVVYATIDLSLRIAASASLSLWRLALLAPAYVFGIVAMFVIRRVSHARGNPIETLDP